MTGHVCFLPRPTYRAVYHCPVCADIFYWEPCSELHARIFHHKAWKAEKTKKENRK